MCYVLVVTLGPGIVSSRHCSLEVQFQMMPAVILCVGVCVCVRACGKYRIFNEGNCFMTV